MSHLSSTNLFVRLFESFPGEKTFQPLLFNILCLSSSSVHLIVLLAAIFPRLLFVICSSSSSVHSPKSFLRYHFFKRSISASPCNGPIITPSQILYVEQSRVYLFMQYHTLNGVTALLEFSSLICILNPLEINVIASKMQNNAKNA